MVLRRACVLRNRRLKYFVYLLMTFLFAKVIISMRSIIGSRFLGTSRDTFKLGQRVMFSEDDIGEAQTCVHPALPLWTKDIRVGELYTPCKPIECSKDHNWVYTANGRFYISNSAVRAHGRVTCAYFPIVRANSDGSQVLGKIVPMLNGSLLTADAFKVICKANDGSRYANVHSCIAPNTKRRQSFGGFKTATGDNSFNVLMFGLDSMSRMAVQRFLPQSHEYFTNVMGGVILEGYNIVGDGTPQALLPILTGYAETELPEVRRGFPDARKIDEAVEFIWTKFEKRGYVTSWGEDMANIGTFNYRMLGFKNQPVHHYMRPFNLEAGNAFHHFPKFCLGSKPLHEVMLNWIKEGIVTHKGAPFFTFAFFSAYSHNNNDCTYLADKAIEEMFKFLKDALLLENTFVLFMSDHGLRLGKIRSSEQGKLEERMPYFGIYVPEKYRQKFPHKYKNLLLNSKRLSTPFDIHATFLDILEQSDVNKSKLKRKSYSLLGEVPINRTCDGSGIEPHWCACLVSKHIPVNNTVVMETGNKSVNIINALLSENGRGLCLKLSLKRIVEAVKLQTNNRVLKFKQSVDYDGRIADLSDTLVVQTVFYQITIETTPADGLFELTSSYDVISGYIGIDMKDVSRINKYGDAPKCISEKVPSLRPYCVCKEH